MVLVVYGFPTKVRLALTYRNVLGSANHRGWHVRERKPIVSSLRCSGFSQSLLLMAKESPALRQACRRLQHV